ncbi:MAG: hypothetical protein V1676_04375 [Candidatus Diapherotrites archaeon]
MPRKPKYLRPKIITYELGKGPIDERTKAVTLAEKLDPNRGNEMTTMEKVLREHNKRWGRKPLGQLPLKKELAMFLKILNAERGYARSALSLKRWAKLPAEIREYLEMNRYIIRLKKGNTQYVALSRAGIQRFAEIADAFEPIENAAQAK